jgi:deoxyadenosine/deoxycytidine kinase
MTQNLKNVRIISIDGSIGSGKTTLMKRIKQHYKDNSKIIFACEPVEEWAKITDEHGTEMLKLFYMNQTVCAFAFQMMAYISRLAGLRKIIRDNQDKDIIIITERSLYTDKYIFEKMLYDQGKIKEYEHKIYLMWFDEFAKDFDINDVIYIKTEPIKCYERIHLRAREGEELIPLAYLEECHTYHEAFLDPNSGLFKNQLVLDGNQDILKNETILCQRLRQIDAFIMPDQNAIFVYEI